MQLYNPEPKSEVEAQTEKIGKIEDSKLAHFVAYGDVVTIKSFRSKFFLHSHTHNYKEGSGNQQVSGFSQGDGKFIFKSKIVEPTPKKLFPIFFILFRKKKKMITGG